MKTQKWYKENEKVPDNAVLIKSQELTYDDENGNEKQVELNLYEIDLEEIK